MTGTLSGRTALITGSTSGIGRATATALSDQGAHVILTGRDTARGDAAVQQLRAGGANVACQRDGTARLP